MRDIQVDSSGVFHCWNCGGKNFSEKRTRRAKAVGVTAGVATFGVLGAATALAAKKRLWCQVCGEYNKMGNAQPYVAKSARPTVKATGSDTGSVVAGVIAIAIAAILLTIYVVTSHAWWWLVVLVPVWLFLALAAAGKVVEILNSNKKRPQSSSARPTVSVPRQAGWYADQFADGRERWWSGTAWTNQTRWPT